MMARWDRRPAGPQARDRRDAGPTEHLSGNEPPASGRASRLSPPSSQPPAPTLLAPRALPPPGILVDTPRAASHVRKVHLAGTALALFSRPFPGRRPGADARQRRVG